MRRSGWLAIALPAIALLVSLAVAAERMRVTDIEGLVSGALVVEPAEMNPNPIGQGGFANGFAFAPGRAELAYSAIEEKGGQLTSVVRIVQVERLWTVPRQQMKTFVDRARRKHTFPENTMVNLPFAERERELLSLKIARSADSLLGQFIEGPIDWSPDGTRLAIYAVTEDPIKSYTTRDLWVVDYAAGKRQPLTHSAWVTEAVWSPDSKWLAFAAEQAEVKAPRSAPKPTPPGLWLANVKSGALRRIGEGGIDLEWSARGNRLKFRRSGDDERGREYDAETGKTAPGALPAMVQFPYEISPDGRYVAILQDAPEGRHLEVRERSTNARLVNLPAEALGCWHPDSRMLAYFDNNCTLVMTSLEGPHRGHAEKVSAEAEIHLVAPFHPLVQWSNQIVPPSWAFRQSRYAQNPEAGEGGSWIALISHGQLRLLGLAHRKPQIHERAALGWLTPQEERSVVCSNMKQIALGLIMYAGDYDTSLPPSYSRVNEVFGPYVPTQDLFDRPGYPKRPVFRYLARGVVRLGGIKDEDSSQLPIGVIDYWKDGGYVAYADGHVQWVPREEMEEVLLRAQEFDRYQRGK